MCVPFCLPAFKGCVTRFKDGKKNCWGQQLRDCIQDHFHMCKGESKIARSDVLLIIELSYNRKTLEPGAVNTFHTQI